MTTNTVKNLNSGLCPLYMCRPSAGFPAPGDDMVEQTLNVHDLVVKNPSATFFVRVAGDSMEGAGIFDGDVLVVDRSVSPTVGRIVVVAVAGEMVVKILGGTASKPLLVSANDNYEPIAITADSECCVWGVVVGSVRVF